MTPAADPAHAAAAGEAPLPARLGITDGMRVALLHAPAEAEVWLGPLPAGVALQHGLRRQDRVDLIIGFVTARDHLARNIGWLVTTLDPSGALWVAWPAATAGVTSDLTEDVIREVAQPLGWAATTASAIGPTWSGLKLVRSEDARRPR